MILITAFALHRIGKQKPLQSGLFLLVGDKEGIFDRRQSPKRGTILCSRFHLCGKEAESVNHLFLNRNVTAQLWQIYLNIGWCPELSYNYFSAGTGEKGRKRSHFGGLPFQLIFGGPDGRKGTPNALKAKANSIQQSKFNCSLFSFC